MENQSLEQRRRSRAVRRCGGPGSGSGRLPNLGDPSHDEVRLEWADLSRKLVKVATLRKATADEKAAFEQQHQARRTRATPFPSQSALIALRACVPMARHCRVALVVWLGRPSDVGVRLLWTSICCLSVLMPLQPPRPPANAELSG